MTSIHPRFPHWIHRLRPDSWLLVGVWLFTRWEPFVPVTDWQGIKVSVQPILEPSLNFWAMAHDAVAWILVACIVYYGQRRIRLDPLLPVAIIIVLGVEVFLANNVVDVDTIAGALLAIVMWYGGIRFTRRRSIICSVILFLFLVIGGVWPFDLRPEPQAFGWIPFQAYMDAPLADSLRIVGASYFFYGGLIFLLWRMGFGPVVGTITAVGVIVLIEIAQIFFGIRTPEITDPILVVLAAVPMILLKQHRRFYGAPKFPQQGKKSLFERSIRFHQDQVDFLELLALDTKLSVSHVVRRIVDETVTRGKVTDVDLFEPSDLQSNLTEGLAAMYANHPPVTRGREWVPNKLYLRRDQVKYLNMMAERSGASLSMATRRLVNHFIYQVDDKKAPEPPRVEYDDLEP